MSAPSTPHPLRCSVIPAPAREPLFDDERIEARYEPFPAERPARRLVLVGRDEVPLPFGEAIDPPRRPIEALRPPRAEAGSLPEPVRFGRYFVQAILEVLCGRRPAGQLARHTSSAVLAGLTRDQAGGSRFEAGGRNPVVHSVRVMEPAQNIAELTAVIQVGARFRAIALRMEGHHGRWRCTRLQIG